MYLFDTNIFLEILLGQGRADACQRALAAVDENHEGWASSFSLHAVEAIVGAKAGRWGVLEKFLSALQEHPHFFVYTTTLEEELEVVRRVPKLGLDFDDALQFWLAEKKGWKLVTLDKDFAKLRSKGVDILAPVEIP